MDKITQAEMITLFGEEMPMEAAMLLYSPPDGMTLKELRIKLRAIAGQRSHPMQAIEFDDHGVIRFRENKIITWLVETGKLDLNEIATRPFSDADRMQVAQQLGYSVSGFGDLSYAHPEIVRQADEIAEQIIAEREADASPQRDGDRTESAPLSPVVEPSLWDPEAEKAASERQGGPHAGEEASEATAEPQTVKGLPDAS